MPFILPYMGILPFVLLGILILFGSCFGIRGMIRRKRAICKVCGMCEDEKVCLVNDMIVPFGFEYVREEDIFANTMNGWQRAFGYCRLYDRSAYYFNMVFDSEPIYFDYGERTWLIEFWKGQY